MPGPKKPVIDDDVSGDTAIKTIISFRIAKPLIYWLKQTATAEGRSTNGFVAELMEDARSWYGLPYAMVEAFEADRAALGCRAGTTSCTCSCGATSRSGSTAPASTGGRRRTPVVSAEGTVREARALPMTLFVTPADVMHALGCSRSLAYEHLRRAAGRGQGVRGLLRVPLPVWERYAAEVFGCGSSGEARSGTAGSTRTASASSGRRSATTAAPPRLARATSSETPPIPLTQPRASAHAAARKASLTQPLELLLRLDDEEIRAGHRSADTREFHERKAGHLVRVFETKDGARVPFPLASLGAPEVEGYISRRRGEGAGDATIAKELSVLRKALRLALRPRLWRGRVDEVIPVAFSPGYEPRKRFLTEDELAKLLAELTPDLAARAAFIVATSACWRETELARDDDVAHGLGAVLLRGTKRKTRLRTVPVVSPVQRSLVEYALEHAAGEGGALFQAWENVRRDLASACERAKIERVSPNDLRRTFANWYVAAGCRSSRSHRRWATRTRGCWSACTADRARSSSRWPFHGHLGSLRTVAPVQQNPRKTALRTDRMDRLE